MTKKQLQKVEQIIEMASDGDLNTAMNQALTIALTTENEEFSHWLECELNGYLEGNETYIGNPKTVPGYRKVAGFFMDDHGNTVQNYYSDLDFLKDYPLREGVSTLESWPKEMKMLSIQGAHAFKWLANELKIPITKFVFSSNAVIAVLQAIRNKLIKQLIEIKKKYKADETYLTRAESIKIINSLHPRVQQIALKYFEDEHYRSAIVDSYIGLIEDIKKKTKIFDKDGSPLMDFVFSVNKPILKVSDDKDIQLGAMWLFKGAVMHLRNANAHKLTEWEDSQKTLEWLAFASSLYRTLDECVLESD